MSRRKKKVLIVDDDYSSRRLIERIIRLNFGFQVVHADDGSEALRAMLKEAPDLVILDMIMPVTNGVEVLKIMNDSDELSKIPVIACTSIGNDKIVKEVIKYGVEGYVVKPVSRKALVDKVAAIENVDME